MSTMTVPPETPPSSETPQQSLLFFSLGPVQPFIEKARSVRDLMTGSYLLAWLTKNAIDALPKDDAGRPRGLITPHHSQIDDAVAPKLPNRFIVALPTNGSDVVATNCRRKCLAAWTTLASQVRKQIEPQFAKAMREWLEEFPQQKDAVREQLDENTAFWFQWWDDQVGSADPAANDSLFDVHTHIVAIDSEQTANAKLLTSVKRKESEVWDDIYDLTWAIDGARKSTRHVHSYSPTKVATAATEFPAKCTMFGTYEQMGPTDTEASRVFWQALAGATIKKEGGTDRTLKGVRLKMARVRQRERLSAIGLVKRFAWPAYLQKEGGHDKVDFPDTATVAAAQWLDVAKSRKQNHFDFEQESAELRKTDDEFAWSGQWLHWPQKDFDKDERQCPQELFDKIQLAVKQASANVPLYYAVLMLDGDKMGDKGRERNGADAQLELSEIIGNFAGDIPGIVKRHHGTLVYAGGDDVLALLPLSTVLECASEISRVFRAIWCATKFDPTTVSAGIAVAHYKQDLRFVLDTAREAEKIAKNSGRDALTLSVCRRSGQHTTAVMDWAFCETLQRWVTWFQQAQDGKGSARWAYTLSAELLHLKGLTDKRAIRSEIGRLVRRSKAEGESIPTRPSSESVEGAKKDISANDDTSSSTHTVRFDSSAVTDAFDEYLRFQNEQKRHPKHSRFLATAPEKQEQLLLRLAVAGFTTLCVSASFLARGREQS